MIWQKKENQNEMAAEKDGEQIEILALVQKADQDMVVVVVEAKVLDVKNDYSGCKTIRKTGRGR